MQHKYLWSGAFLLALAAAATYLGIDHARQYPEWVLNRLGLTPIFAIVQNNPQAGGAQMVGVQAGAPAAAQTRPRAQPYRVSAVGTVKAGTPTAQTDNVN